MNSNTVNDAAGGVSPRSVKRIFVQAARRSTRHTRLTRKGKEMNTNMKRVISGLAALGIALSGMALGTSSAWAGGESGKPVDIPAGNITIGAEGKGTIAISGSEIEHRFNGYRLGYLTSISYNQIDDADNASMSGYTLATNQDYKDAIETALAAIKDSKAKVDADKAKTLKERYLADKNYCGSECDATGAPNPLGWFFENYGDGYENDSNWGGDAKDGSSASVLRKFATEVSKALSTAEATYFGDNALKVDEEGQEVSQGYYLLRDVTSLGDNNETQSAPILVSSTYVVTIGENEVTFNKDAQDRDLGAAYLKYSAPTITKEVVTDETGATAQGQPDYAVGDTVYYKLTADLPYYTGYATPGRVYQITDTASKGLTVGNDAVVSVKVTAIDGSEDPEQILSATTDYTVKTETSADTVAEAYKGGQTTTIDFSNYVNCSDKSVSAGENGKILEGGTITVIFKATLNTNALISDNGHMNGNPNKDSLTYSYQPENVSEAHTTPSDEVNVYTYRFRLHKTDKGGKDLAGAKFVVSTPGETSKWLKWDADNNKWGSADSEVDATVFTSNDKGEVVATVGDTTVNLDRLDSGKYTVKEISAPTGYTQAFLPTFTFTITPTMGSEADGHKTITNVTFSAKDAVKSAYVTDASAITTDGIDQNAWQYTIYNAKNLTELPMTGGAGLVAIIAVGVLLAGAGTAAAVRSRKSNSRAVRI